MRLQPRPDINAARSHFLYLACLVLAGFACPCHAQDSPSLAQQAKIVLQKHCYRCHGEGGRVEGGFNYLLDRNRLIERRKIIPGKAIESRLVKRVRAGEMPPEDVKQRLNDDEVATLHRWIDQGADDFNPPRPKRQRPSRHVEIELVIKDLKSLPQADRPFTRYFSISHLHYAGRTEDELDSYRQAISKLINSLSWARNIAQPKPIDAEGTILRIDLRNYNWTPREWQLLEASYPFGMLFNTPIEREAQQNTRTQFPYLRGDWFVFAAALPPLYHDLLRLPSRERDLEKMLRLSVLDNIADGVAVRAGFNGSGVSQNNRLIERHETLFGAYWKSYDFASSTGKSNLFGFPLGPSRVANCFQHDGGEIIFSLPNGLHAYMLVDAAGSRMVKGPTEIVSDPRRPDRAVVNGLSCMSCHAHGINPREDQIGPHVRKNSQAFLKSEFRTIDALYVPAQDMQKLVEQDNKRYQASVAATGCALSKTEPVAALARHFESELGIELVAAELFMSTEELRKRFKDSTTLARNLGALSLEGGTIQRALFIESFPKLVGELELGTAVIPPARPITGWWTADLRTTRFPNSWTGKGLSPQGLFPQPPPRPKLPPTQVVIQVNQIAKDQHVYWRLQMGRNAAPLRAFAISPQNKWLFAHETAVGIVQFHQKYSRTEPRQRLKGHKGYVLDIAFSPDASLLATGSVDQTARIWDAETGAERLTLSEHSGFVHAVRFAPDGKTLATASDRARVWSTATGARLTVIPTAGSVHTLEFAPDGRTLATGGRALEIWTTDIDLPRKIATLEDNSEQTIKALAFSSDGRLLAAGRSDGTIRIWNVAEPGKEVSQTPRLLTANNEQGSAAHSQPVTDLTFIPTTHTLLSTSGNEEPKVPGEYRAWDGDTGKLLVAEQGHAGSISKVVVAADGRHAITSSFDGQIRYRDIMALDKVRLNPFEGHFISITSLDTSPDSKYLLTGGPDRTMRLWDVETGAQLQRFDGHKDSVLSLAFSRDGTTAYSTDGQKLLHQWDLTTGKLKKDHEFPAPIVRFFLSGDRKTMAVVLGGGRVHIVDSETMQTRSQFSGPVAGIRLSGDGKRVACIYESKQYRILDFNGKEITRIGPNKSNHFRCGVFSPDNKYFYTGDYSNYVIKWDAQTGAELLRCKGHLKPVWDIALLDNGTKVMAISRDNKQHAPDEPQCILWDTDNGKELKRWQGLSTFLYRLAVTPDNRTVFVTDRDQLKVLKLAKGTTD